MLWCPVLHVLEHSRATFEMFPRGIGEQSYFLALIAVVTAGMELPSSSSTKALQVKWTKEDDKELWLGAVQAEKSRAALLC